MKIINMIPVNKRLKERINKLSMAWFYRSKNKHFYCNLCHNWHTGFLPLDVYQLVDNKFEYAVDDFETLNIDNYFCPICGSSDRDRLYKAFLENEFNNVEHNRQYSFLDFAPSRCIAKWVKTKNFLVCRSADLLIDGVDDKVDIQNMDIYKDESFDYILCSHVLEHVEDDNKATKELFRVLKRGGKALIMAPIHLAINDTIEFDNLTSEEQRWKYYGQGDHARLYSKKGFVTLLNDAGFIVNQINPVQLFGNQCYFFGVLSKSCLYVVSK